MLLAFEAGVQVKPLKEVTDTDALNYIESSASKEQKIVTREEDNSTDEDTDSEIDTDNNDSGKDDTFEHTEKFHYIFAT
ncbi:hypothetical protein V9T40_003360 [Parthenolecanium corni]|uniref:Uncharacterized protein n=1 Tax=Parthenolecanium corni TaxID=536013 RepID=A0AAN9TUW8_9HEMI